MLWRTVLNHRGCRLCQALCCPPTHWSARTLRWWCQNPIPTLSTRKQPSLSIFAGKKHSSLATSRSTRPQPKCQTVRPPLQRGKSQIPSKPPQIARCFERKENYIFLEVSFEVSDCIPSLLSLKLPSYFEPSRSFSKICGVYVRFAHKPVQFAVDRNTFHGRK